MRVVGTVLTQDDAIDLDGKMRKDLDLIDGVLAGIRRAEELIEQGEYEAANREFRALIRNNFRIDFSRLIGLALHLRTVPAAAEVRVTSQGQTTRLLGRITPEGIATAPARTSPRCTERRIAGLSLSPAAAMKRPRSADRLKKVSSSSRPAAFRRGPTAKPKSAATARRDDRPAASSNASTV